MTSDDLKHDLQLVAGNFDFSNLPENHSLYDPNHKAQLFRFKEELGLKPILRYIGLASKVY